MLTRRLLSLSRSPSALPRSFTTTSVQHRVPALADIKPNNASAFDKKQSEFRSHGREAQKLKQQQDSQSATAASSAPSAPYNAVPGAAPASNASGSGFSTASTSPNVNDLGQVALGSLSTHNTGQARDQSTQQESSKSQGALSSLIYGTHEGQQMDKDIEKSFSQVLARGKYMHSIVFHSVKPEKVDEYVNLVGGWYPKVASTKENHVNLVGSWRTEVGDCDTFSMSSASVPPPFALISQEKNPTNETPLPLTTQSTYGNTNATKATTPPSTASPRTPPSPTSTKNSKD